jgi:O-methyltransferase
MGLIKRIKKKLRIWSKGRHKRLRFSPRLRAYLDQSALAGADERFVAAHRGTAALSQAIMQTAPDQARFLGVLARAAGAKRALDIGTFRGFSALALSLAMGDEGRVVSIDKNADIMEEAKQMWREAGVFDRIDARTGAATEVLRSLVGESRVDIAVVDADKHGYEGYLEQLQTLVRPGGLVVFDNTLWAGRVADADSADPAARALARFNTAVLERFGHGASIVPAWDGMTIVSI